MLLQISIDTIGQFLDMYWGFIVFVGAVAWGMIKIHFKQQAQGKEIMDIRKGEIIQIKSQLAGLRADMERHDETDKQVERNLTALIQRNHTSALDAAMGVKEKLDTAAVMHDKKLDRITTSLVAVETKMDLLLTGKIDIRK